MAPTGIRQSRLPCCALIWGSPGPVAPEQAPNDPTTPHYPAVSGGSARTARPHKRSASQSRLLCPISAPSASSRPRLASTFPHTAAAQCRVRPMLPDQPPREARVLHRARMSQNVASRLLGGQRPIAPSTHTNTHTKYHGSQTRGLERRQRALAAHDVRVCATPKQLLRGPHGPDPRSNDKDAHFALRPAQAPSPLAGRTRQCKQMGERFVQRCTLTSASALGSSPASSAATKPSRSPRVMSRIASAAMGPAACCVMLRLPRLDHPVAVCLWKRVLTESLGSPVDVTNSQSIAFQARSRKGCRFERGPRQLRGET